MSGSGHQGGNVGKTRPGPMLFSCRSFGKNQQRGRENRAGSNGLSSFLMMLTNWIYSDRMGQVRGCCAAGATLALNDAGHAKWSSRHGLPAVSVSLSGRS